ncbi:RNA-directed DNA polymerase, eukaryota, reverse transcriptase zinc-binding domain protein [Tanacetum coccineum]
MMVIHSCRQAMLFLIESVDKRIKSFCSFIYASNSSIERRELWNTLRNHSSGFNFTWTRSLKNPLSSTLKKLIRIMINERIMRTRKNKSKVETICKEDESKVVGEKVLEQFVNHFKIFLGKSQFVQSLSNMDDYVQAKLSEEEALAMITMIPGEINATLIALVPKIDNPYKVSNFRPIACCNVLYKCISKILTSRIKDGLGKVVCLNHSAFILGRHIQDNILISHEILKGYNRKNGAKRCAIKIDIQKACDTVNCNFLRNSLLLVGFHEVMFN